MISQDPMTSLNRCSRSAVRLRRRFVRTGSGPDVTHSTWRSPNSNGCACRPPAIVRGTFPTVRRHASAGGGEMAIACKPRLLIADEPTSALDVTIQVQFMDLIESIQEETGASLLFITMTWAWRRASAIELRSCTPGASSRQPTRQRSRTPRIPTHRDCWNRCRGSNHAANGCSRSSAPPNPLNCRAAAVPSAARMRRTGAERRAAAQRPWRWSHRGLLAERGLSVGGSGNRRCNVPFQNAGWAHGSRGRRRQHLRRTAKRWRLSVSRMWQEHFAKLVLGLRHSRRARFGSRAAVSGLRGRALKHYRRQVQAVFGSLFARSIRPANCIDSVRTPHRARYPAARDWCEGRRGAEMVGLPETAARLYPHEFRVVGDGVWRSRVR